MEVRKTKEEIDDQVLRLIKEKKKEKAIQLYKSKHNVSDWEARKYISNLEKSIEPKKNIPVAIGCWFVLIVSIILIVFFLFKTCSQIEDERISSEVKLLEAEEKRREQKRKIWSVENPMSETKEDDPNLIKIAENDFWLIVKQMDKEYRENNYKELNRLLNEHKQTIYDLYIEHTEIQIDAKNDALNRARSEGMKDTKYINWYKYYLDPKVEIFRSKYGMNKRCYMIFTTYYNCCYNHSQDPYCKDGNSILKNGYIWKLK